MTRALIVGPRDEMETVIEALYDLKLLHIVDHKEGQDELGIGNPLPQASQASEVLVKLRSIASVLQIEKVSPKATEEVSGDIRERILSLELNISEEDSARKKTQALIADLSRKIEEMTPFAQLDLALADYGGYENLEVLAGKTSREIAGLETVTSEHEAFEAPGFLAVFVAKARAVEMREFLTQRGFSAVAVPEGDRLPRQVLAELTAEKGRWERRMSEIEERLVTLRERYADFLVTAKAHLEVRVEKAEAPLRFAVTEHSLVVEGWVPQETVSAVQDALAKVPGVFFSELETDEHSEDPPVLMRNIRPFRPFEMLVKLFSAPNYHEIDPTFIVALVFPIFFGLMIGDAGYGLAWFLFGLWLLKKIRQPGEFRDLVITVTWGGLFAFVFGALIFGEAFGIPFHKPLEAASPAEMFNWSDNILGFRVPLESRMEKLHQVSDFIVLSLAAAYLHLMIGFLIGFFNDIGHNKKHALGKVSWLVILSGLFAVLVARAARWPGMGRAVWDGPLSWFPRGGWEYPAVGFTAINPIPSFAVYMLVAGIGILIATEGGLRFMEVFGLVANVVSYARLAGVGVAKAAMAFAFNVIVLQNFVFPWQRGGSIGLLVAGLVVAFLAHFMIFLLGAVSAFIQSIRLNYVEFFLKFYKGAGVLFRPFGMRAKPEV